jgi:hypothetical protein
MNKKDLSKDLKILVSSGKKFNNSILELCLISIEQTIFKQNWMKLMNKCNFPVLFHLHHLLIILGIEKWNKKRHKSIYIREILKKISYLKSK